MVIKLCDFAIASFLFRNDIHMLHHNVTGLNFREIHELFGEFYDKALEDFDYGIEHAILTNEISAAPNMTHIFQENKNLILQHWMCITTETLFPIKKALEEFEDKSKDYLYIFDEVRKYCDSKNYNDIVSDLDSMKSYWSLEAKYKIKRTLQ